MKKNKRKLYKLNLFPLFELPKTQSNLLNNNNNSPSYQSVLTGNICKEAASSILKRDSNRRVQLTIY